MRPELETWVLENVPDGEKLLKEEDPNRLLEAIDEMMLLSLDQQYRPTKRTGEIVQKYDAIYSELD